MTPPEIMAGMKKKNLELSMKNDEYILLAEKRALCERAYNVALAAATLRLKTDGLSIGLIGTLAKADETAAKLKFEYEVSMAVEKACLQAIKSTVIGIDSYRSLLSWQKAEKGRPPDGP